MNCPECLEQLHSLLDGDRIDRAALAGHLAGCASCRETFAVADQLREGLSRIVLPSVPAGFSRRVRDEWLGRRARLRRFAYASMAVAAAAMIGVTIWGASILWSRPHRNEIVKPEPEQTQPQPPSEGKPGKPVAQVTQGFVSFGSQFTSSMTRQARPLMARLPDAKLPVPNAILPIGPVGLAVSNGLEPILDSVSGVANTILKSLPLEDGESKEK